MTAIATQRPSSGPRRPAAQRPLRPRQVRRRPNFALRRRLAALLTIALIALVVSGVWAMRSEAASDTGPLELTVVVAPGETVWDIANDYVPEGAHPQAYVADVLRYNDIEPAAVQPGTVLRLPRG